MMNWDNLPAWLDNPILVKHIRSRLRPQPFFASLAVVVMLCMCILWAGYQLNMFVSGGAAGWLLALQTIILVIMGASQVNGSVNGARASGILDFHRVSPMTPIELTLGFFFGAPIREYLLFAATLPCLAVCMAFGVPSPRAAIQLMIMLLAITWTFHGLALLSGLMSKAKNTTGNVIGIIVLILFFGMSLVTGGSYSVNVAEGEMRFHFYGISLPWLPVVLIYQLPLLFFILLASTRKMRSARLHPLSKPEAIAAMITFAALVLGGIWERESYEVLEVVALYLLAAPALMLALMVTPNQSEYYKGLWRAHKLGRGRLPWWDDLSVNWVGLAIIAGIVLAAGTIAGAFPGQTAPSFAGGAPAGSYPLALATAVLVVAYFGLAFQYFQLRFGGRGKTYFSLFLFVTWLLPLVAAWIQVAAWGPSSSEESGYPFFALSPVAGIGMVAGVGDQAVARAIQSAAITPALLFTFVFNYLLIGARKRVIRAVYLAAANRKQAQDEAASVAPILDGRIGMEPSS
ncbi:MAG: hypothetical protein ACLQGP_01565 [Isosphaeraceae bacterium]